MSELLVFSVRLKAQRVPCTRKPFPSYKHTVSIAQNAAEILRYGMQLYSRYGTFETKDKWRLQLGLGRMNDQVTENNEWLPASVGTQNDHYVRQK